MGRRKNNPELVEELVDGRWTMDQDEFEEKYYSLSSSDMSKVAEAIDGMEEEFLSGQLDDEYDDVASCESWCGNPMYPDCMDSCKLYD